MSIPAASISIVGVGESDIGLVPGSSPMSLGVQAAKAALADAGLDKTDVDGLFVLNSYLDYHVRYSNAFSEYFGLSSDRLRVVETVGLGSASSSGHALQLAAASVASGQCRTALIIAGDNFLTYGGRDMALKALAMNRNKEFEDPYGPLVAATFAVIATRYMEDHGATSEQLAHVAVSARNYAALNPRAHMHGKPITIEDVLASPMISTPFHRLDCSLVSDGGCALVLRRTDDIGDPRSRPVNVLASETCYGTGQGLTHDSFSQLPHLYTLREGARTASGRAFSHAGLSKDDVDVLFTYDPFTIVPILFLEGFGYCGDGEGARFVTEGHIGPGGDLPLNTHGGLLSYCHSGFPGGMFMLTEAVRQLRGEGLGYQVKDPKVALIQGYGAQMGIFPATLLGRG
ncbi:hypothetical protein [Bosea sp. (in: a-proteobacteria)]|uniref:thiolase C-terminal domain-containing protein n=1 Tax=Bosea sp. (in: a-proteobacteria) TaxID=1871050 RepID=UPI002630652A|nr:hypothetical protein [Bosea sp. (in: a-proteobacteria)]MCO5090944.1 hypothetical protein [Bosea sp. (in: a-proteobacteria)]